MTPPVTQTQEHLNLLAILHFVYAGVLAISFIIPALGILAIGGWQGEGHVVTPHPDGGEVFTYHSGAWRGLVVLTGTIGLVTTTLVLLAGFKLKARRSRMFCMVIAALECLSFPIGTALGVFTLIVLNKVEAQDIFGG